MYRNSSLIIEILRSAALDEFTPDLSDNLYQVTKENLLQLNHFLLTPMFAYLAEKQQHGISPDIQKDLISIKLTSEFLCASKISSLVELNRIEQGMYLLKGASLFLDLFPESYIRVMGDIDILVKNSLLQRYHDSLKRLGYEQESDYTNEFYESMHHLMPYHKLGSDTWIEIHHHIVPSHRKSGEMLVFEPEYFFENAEFVKHGELSFYRPATELNLLYTITHWVEEFRVKDSVVQLLDVIYLMQHKRGFSWERFISLIDNKYSATYAYIVLGYLTKNKIIELDAGAWRDIEKINKTIGQIDEYVLHGIIRSLQDRKSITYRVLGETNLSIIWFHLISDKNIFRKYISIVSSVAFPPHCQNRYSFSFQWRRFRAMLGI